MNSWFEVKDRPQGIIVASRIRLARNIDGYVFPEQLLPEQRNDLIGIVKKELEDLNLHYIDTEQLEPEQKMMLKEHRVINSGLMNRSEPMGLLISEDESVSILIGGDDHLRMQCIRSGSFLRKEWEIMNDLDNQVNEKFDYAFHEHYGYMTAFPTNMGTGMRASVVLHLPIISSSRDFKHLSAELARVGIVMKGVYGDTYAENYGALYRISNQKTLGLSENEIIDNVEKFAMQLADQERKAENDMLKNHHLELEDEAYKSYGILEYARKLSLKEAMVYLSQVRLGMANGVLKPKAPVNIHSLMVKAQPGSLCSNAGRHLDEDEIPVFRAEMIHRELPELISGN